MKKKLVLMTSALMTIGLLVGCGANKQHQHSFKEVAEVPATCTGNGVRAHYTCGGCNKIFDANKKETTLEALTIAAFGHDYQFNSFVWTGNSAQAKYVCTHDASHVEMHDATVTDEVTTAPTCEGKGVRTYTASYNGHVDSKTADIEAIGHDFQFDSFVWDGFNAQAKYVCSRDASHIEMHAAIVTSEVTTDPTCEGKGVRTYTASYEGHTDTKIDEIDPLDHDFQFVSFVWSENWDKAQAKYVCTHDSTHIEYYDATIETNTIPATCENDGKTTYTALYKGYSDVKEQTIPATGHSYGEPTYVWSSDNLTCNARRVCSHDASHVEEEVANAVISNETATCTEDGTATYTVTFKNTAFASQVKNNVPVKAYGHDYKFDSFVWTETPGAFTAQAKFVCSHDHEHVDLHDAEVGSETTKVATCEGSGAKTYTATYENHVDTKVEDIAALGHSLSKIEGIAAKCEADGVIEHWHCSRCKNDYSDAQGINRITNTVIPAIGHKWGTPTYQLNGELTNCTASVSCLNDPSHVESETVGISSKYYTDEETSKEYYGYKTSSFTNPKFSSQTFPVFSLVVKEGGYEIASCDPASLNGDLVIPDSINNKAIVAIGENAFKNATNITSITIPATVTAIESDAFSGCSGITTVDLKNVTTIGNGAFEQTGLTSIVIPDNVTSLGDNSFAGCENLATVTLGEGVTTIGNGAFEQTGLTSIVIPDNVTSLGDNSFAGCENLATVSLGEGVTTIGNGAFSGNENISSIVIPDSVTSLGEGAFSGCEGLTTITIGTGITSIGNNAFNGCDNLEVVNVRVESLDNFFEIEGRSGIPGTIHFLDEENTEIEVILVPEGVTVIDSHTFDGNKNITSITVSDTVTTIEAGAFDGCEGLETVTIGKGIKNIGEGAFEGCPSLTSVVIDDEATGVTIGKSAFKDCTNLVTVDLGDSVEVIGSGAFQGCTGIETITIGKDVKTIGDSAFAGCTSITSISIPDDATDVTIGNNAFQGCTALESVDLGEGVVSIGTSAFAGLTGIQSIVFPDSLTTISESAFQGCTGITSVDFGEGLVTLGKGAFRECSFSTVTLPDGVETISIGCFIGCPNLETVTLGEGVKTIGIQAFAYCQSLTSFTMSDAAEHASIDPAAFMMCPNLETVTLGEGVETIGDDAFFQCTALTSITLPDSVVSIGRTAFKGCNNLQSVNIGKGLVSIGDEAFYNCDRLKTVTFAEGCELTTIGDYVFYACFGLKAIELPATVVNIGEFAFANCQSLASFSFLGTIEQWNAIVKGSDWHYQSTQLTVVHCSDGDVNL